MEGNKLQTGLHKMWSTLRDRERQREGGRERERGGLAQYWGANVGRRGGVGAHTPTRTYNNNTN